MRFKVNDAERMRIASTGNVGIGTTSPTSNCRLHISDSDAQIELEGTGGSNSGFIDFDGTNFQISTNRNMKDGAFSNTGKSNATIILSGADGASHIAFYTASPNNTTASERMRINSSGQLLIGRTSASYDTSGIEVEGASSGGKGAVLFQGTGDNGPAINAYKTSTTTDSSARFIQFAANSGSTPMGGIGGNGASNAQFITLSDEREKENITPVVSVLDKVMNLNVVSFDWIKHDEHIKAGFIAQNVEKYFPEYVVENVSNEGEEARKGTTGGMSAGYIAVLTKAIQEQQQEIQDLKSRIETLEG